MLACCIDPHHFQKLGWRHASFTQEHSGKIAGVHPHAICKNLNPQIFRMMRHDPCLHVTQIGTAARLGRDIRAELGLPAGPFDENHQILCDH
jgi:hypothetical protein